jgi:hypothetical protein
MVQAIIVIAVGLLLLHLAGGAVHHTRYRRRGHRVNVGWSLSRGWWADTRIFGGNYYHRL